MEFKNSIEMLDHIINGIPTNKKFHLLSTALKRREYGAARILAACEDISTEMLEKAQAIVKSSK